MKIAKKLLVLALALVALTLVMSISIFAEESTDPATCEHTYDWNIVGCPKCGTLAVLDEGSTNVSSNLGYTIYFATTFSDLSNTNYDVIRLKNNISLNSGDKITNANAIIDLGGNVLYRNGGWLGLRIVAAKGFVNGYVYKTNGGSQAMAVTSLEFMEDIKIVANSTKSNNATGLIMNTAGAYLGSMKNVTICAGVLANLNGNDFDFVNVGDNGIYNHGIEATQGTIGSMENVKISTYGQAITSAAKIGTMTNCVFSGDNIALNITKLQSEMEFVNCEIHSKNLAIYIADAATSTEEAPVSFEIGNTKFVTDGAVFDISSHIIDNEMFADLTSAKALVNGQLYTSLEDAIDALEASTEEVTTFALIADLAVDTTIVINKEVHFSFGGASYDVPVYGTNQVTHKTVSGYTVTSSVDVVFQVSEGGNLVVNGAGTLEGTETAIVADGGEVVINAGTYVGYNPREFVSTESCVVNTDGTYAITAEHDYDDDVGQDKTNYQVDGVCNNCGFVRGNFAVDNVYYATLEEAYAAALENGKQIVLATDIVIEGDEVWDLTGATFNFNNLAVTVNGSLSIVGGKYSQDVSEYVDSEYCMQKNEDYYDLVAHAWEDATCTAPKTCSACGATEGEALGHDMSVAATCETALKCSRCDYTEGEALGHNYVPGEEVDGQTVFTCTNCGDSYTCEHVYEIIESADATCTTNGYIKYECTECGETKKEANGVATGHTYDWKVGGCPACGTLPVPDEEGGKVSTNLGYTVFFASSWSEINANVSASSIYDVIKLTADTKVPSGNNYAKVQNANILIDLGGHSITSSVGLAPLYLYAAKGLVNGSIIHNYGRQALYVCNVEFIENLEIIVGATYANNTTGIYLAYNASYAAGFEGSTGSYIGSMKNVTIDSKRDANGNYIDNCGLFNHGIEFSNANSIIGDLENVKVYSRGQAITIMAKEIGTMTNCVFDGTNIGINIGNLQDDINLVNCTVSSETLAVRIGGASSNALSFNFDANTSISSDGSVYYIPDSIKGYEGFESLTTAVALVNGVLYGTLEDAMAALLASTEEVTTFTLIGDLTLDAPIEINKNVHFSFGGGTFKIPTTGDKTFTEMTADGFTVTAPNGAFVVAEGGALTVSGDGKLVGNENAIVTNGGSAVVTAGSYEGYNPQAYVSADACVANIDGTYVIGAHTYDDGVMQDKVTYKVDGDCEVCGFVRGHFAVDYVYYMTLEEALEVALASGNGIVLATDIVIDGDVIWDFTGTSFNFNNRNVTVNGSLSIVGGSFNISVSEYLPDGYCCTYNSKTYKYVVNAHSWVDATCETAKTCSICGKEEGEALGHNYTEWTYNPSTGAIERACQNGCGEAEAIAVVATANGEYYATLQDAINAGGEVVLLTDITLDATINVTGEVTLDLNGYTISQIYEQTAGYQMILNDGTLVINDSVGGGKISYTDIGNGGEYISDTIYNRGVLVINGGTIENLSSSTVASNGYPHAVDTYSGIRDTSVTINGGTIYCASYSAIRMFCVSAKYKADLVINDGTIKGSIDMQNGTTKVANGTLTINGGTFEKTSSRANVRFANWNGGATEYGIAAAITGGTFDAGINTAYVPAAANWDNKIVTGGTFAEDVSAYLADGYAQVDGVVGLCTHENCEAVETAPTCTEGGYTTYTCACGYTYTGDVTEPTGHSYEIADVTETEIVYACTVCGNSYAESNVPEHTHVEVEIPAVLPTPSTVGMTAGTMCSECGEILVAPVEVVVEATPSYKTFGIGATDLVLGNNISLNYKVNVAEGYNNPYMVFVFEDKEYVVTEYTIDPSNGRLVFNFAETRPHKIAENIKAYVYGETENGYAVDVYEYSVMKYCESKLKKNEAVDVISDLLVFGAQTQKYVNPDVADEDLITTIVESHGYTLTPSTFTSIPAASKAQYVDVDEGDDLVWKSSTVVLGASSQMVYKFVAEDITGLYIKIEVDGVEKMMIDASELEIDPANGRYVVSVNCVSAVQYGSEVKATFVRNGVESDSVSYSINGFLYNNLAKNEGTTLGNLMKALYMYGATTYNYIYNK